MSSTGSGWASADRPGRQSPADFVLSDYSAAERKVLPFQVDRAADAVEVLVSDGLAATQATYNS